MQASHVAFRRMVFRALAITVALVALSAQLRAHDLSHSESEMTVLNGDVQARLQLDLVGFGGLQWRGIDRLSYAELDARIESIFGLIKTHLRVSGDTHEPSAVTLIRYSLVDNHVLDARVRYRFDRPIGELVVRSTLETVTAADHQHVIRVQFGTARQEALLTALAPAATFVGTSAWRGLLSALFAGARTTISVSTPVLAAAMIGLGAASRRALLLMLSVTALGSLVALAVTVMTSATFSPNALNLLAAAAVAVLGSATAMKSRDSDRQLLILVFALSWTLAWLAARGVQGLPFSAGATAFAVGALAAVTVVAFTIFVATRRSSHLGLMRRVSALIAIAFATYLIVKPWLGL